MNMSRTCKIKVLVLTGTMNVGGIENQLMHLLRQADRDQFQIDFTTTIEQPYYKNEIESLGSKCILIPSTDGIHFIRYCKALYRVLREGEYDIVHSHELFHSGMVLLTARLAGVKHRFVHAHNCMEGHDPKKKKSLKRRVYNIIMQFLIQRNATEFIACSSYAGKFLYGEKIATQPNYHLIFNSVDTSVFMKEDIDKEKVSEFIDDGWINVLHVARFSPVKNQLFTAEIAQELKKRNQKIRILCVGNKGEEYDEMVMKKIKEYGIENRMLLLGVRSDVSELMQISEAFLLPSLYEGMPLVMIEAQAAGLPCVTADTYSREVDFDIGMVEWLNLEDGSAAWADAVERAIAHGKADKNDVLRAIEKKGFDSRDFCKKICDLYQNACKSSLM